MAKLISKTYGDALLELAIEENQTDALLEESSALLDILGTEKDLDRLMTHPQISKAERIRILEEVFGGRMSDNMMGFFRIVIEKDRYGQIREILTYFVEEVKALRGIGTAYVTTPTPLRAEQQEALVKKLLETTQYHTIELQLQVDPSLIGGIVIRIGDRVVDGSIKTKLDTLQRQLLRVQV